VQDNHSFSTIGVVRGLHYQIEHPQGKLIRAVSGEIFDVVVDIRRGSATYGATASALLSATNRRQLWVPEGFAHGFLVVSESADVLYKTTDYWFPAHERTLLWNDPSLAIEWPLRGAPRLSKKDAAGSLLGVAEVFE
jgi:dTDP-4-dehydrorhamnose 3,5-epimerase